MKVGSRTLISHTYTNDANRRLARSDYGNGDYMSYSYDSYGRVTGTGYEDGTGTTTQYDNNGNVGAVTGNGRRTKYYYDALERLMRYEETGTGYSNAVQWAYDDKNNLSSQAQTLNGTNYTTGYTYDNDNRLTKATQGTVSASYTYDGFSRLTKIQAKNGTTAVVTSNIGYQTPFSTATSAQVSTWGIDSPVNSVDKTYSYSYDGRGNILTVSDGSNTTSYVYDGLDQLVRENNQAAGKTWIYAYDAGGNITARKEYAYTTGTLGTATDTVSYGYGDSSWKDLLTSYDGQTITSDAIGNMLTDGTWTYTWQHGRQLASMAKSGMTLSYAYNADGLRTQKTVSGGTSQTYAYLNGTLTNSTYGSSALHYTYDSTGPCSVTYGGSTYYYLKNAQGDVLGIVNASGTQVVAYTYDAWGKVLTKTGSMAATLGSASPFRYRGYVYDEETELYYLQSRYYNPSMGRFINADSVSDGEAGLLGYNQFIYCSNNPVKNSDPDGHGIFSSFLNTVRMVYTVIKQALIAKNRKHNVKNDVTTRGKGGGRGGSGTINDQNVPNSGVSNVEYGSKNMDWNGCEVIATYNARVLTGQQASMADLATQFQQAHAMIGFGYLGSDPHMIGAVLAKNDMDYSRVNSAGEMTEEGIYIISFWNDNAPWHGLHTVAVSYDGTNYTAYNLLGDGSEYYISLSDYSKSYICGYYLR